MAEQFSSECDRKYFKAELSFINCPDGGASKHNVPENVLKRSETFLIISPG